MLEGFPPPGQAEQVRPSQPWRRVYVWLVYALLLFIWPLATFLTTPSRLDDVALYLRLSHLTVYFNTGLVLWLMFFLVWSAQRVAGRPLREIGFARPKPIDPLIAIAFLLGANLFLNALAWMLKLFGMEVPDMAIKALLPVTGLERAAWVLLSVTAGICEESCFRGFLLTEGRRFGLPWAPLVIASSLAFGVGHLYQGIAGGLLIFVYGVLFCALRLWRGSLWPGVWAHIWQNVGAMALGRWAGY